MYACPPTCNFVLKQLTKKISLKKTHTVNGNLLKQVLYTYCHMNIRLKGITLKYLNKRQKLTCFNFKTTVERYLRVLCNPTKLLNLNIMKKNPQMPFLFKKVTNWILISKTTFCQKQDFCIKHEKGQTAHRSHLTIHDLSL